MAEEHIWRLYGVETVIESDSEPFLRFASMSLRPYLQAGIWNPSLVAGPRLRVTLSLRQRVNPVSFFRDTERLGKRAGMFGDAYRCLDGRLAIEARWQDGTLVVQAWLTEAATWLGRCRRVLDRTWATSGDDYFLFVRQLVWFPLFGLLARHAGVHVLHGAAVNFAGRGLLLAGLSGTGKTTAGLGIALTGHAALLADNYVLFDDARLYPFMDWIRLHPDAERRIQDLRQLGVPALSRFGRSYYQLPQSFVGGPAEPRVVVLPRLGPRFRVREISPAEAMDHILITGDVSRELPHHHASGLIETLIPTTGSSYVQMVRALEALVARCRVLEVVLGPQEPAAEALRRVVNDAL